MTASSSMKAPGVTAMESHVVRFVDHVPSPINSLALTPPSTHRQYLAVARDNGDIELRLPQCAYYVERVIPGGENRMPSSLAWAHESVLADPDFYDDNEERAWALKRLLAKRPRLFSASLNGYITEWNIESLLPVKIVDATGGGVWSLAVNPAGTMLAAGCDDGCIRLYDLTDDQVTLARTFYKQKGRVLSLAWHPSGNFLVSGSDDSVLRQWDVATGQPLDRATLERKNRKQTVVWSILVLPNGTIVTGNSMGRVEFWDWDTATLLHTIVAHEADVLSLTASKDGSQVFSASVDRNVAQLRAEGKTWVKAHVRKYHANDVKAICMVETKGAHDLVSGGVDTELTIVPLGAGGFRSSVQRRMDEFQVPRISIAADRDVLLARYDNSLRLFQLGTTDVEEASLAERKYRSKLDVTQPASLLAEMRLSSVRNVEQAVISRDGEWVVASHMDAVKLWHVGYAQGNELAVQLTKTKSKLPSLRHLATAPVASSTGESEREAAAIFAHSPNAFQGGSLVAGVDAKNAVQVYHLPPLSKSWVPVHVATFTHHGGSHVAHVALSKNGRFLASADAQARAFVVDLWSATAHAAGLPKPDAVISSTPSLPLVSESFFEKKVFPQYAPLAVTSLQFTCAQTLDKAGLVASQVEYLVMTLSNNDFYIYTAPGFEQHKWTRTNLSRMGADFRDRADYFRGAYALNASRMLLWTSHWVLAVDLNKDLPSLNKRKHKADGKPSSASAVLGREGELADRGYSFFSHYKHMMHMEIVGAHKMVVVERPWVDLVTSLPDAFAGKKYGM
ncbi:WD40-repeat-containing domain protein [Catenaria anguillulae PL171]|uniref:WD40-repeat-containing domain protein n=1 Tax=Catenaria anguillulae PL171 TaxID=765915 RepID=A0A1Y2HR27_9FUNG|nr:WD40-repeat-containing domain protein [Catenaria anguillulae PL171]